MRPASAGFVVLVPSPAVKVYRRRRLLALFIVALYVLALAGLIWTLFQINTLLTMFEA